MTDLIQRAREEWCEIHDPEGWPHTNVCPTYVVAALLDVLERGFDECELRSCCATPIYKPHRDDCLASAAKAAITRTLDQKP